jgi:hypothetical protein
MKTSLRQVAKVRGLTEHRARRLTGQSAHICATTDGVDPAHRVGDIRAIIADFSVRYVVMITRISPDLDGQGVGLAWPSVLRSNGSSGV